MQAIIDSINIYDANNNQRNVTFTSGVNVITGDSKTGKSALLEIVDFCLFSKTSSIPKGIITNFAIFYAIVLKTEAGYLVIGRPAHIPTFLFLDQPSQVYFPSKKTI
ncbi:MAG: DUF3732 domain-containing protein [Pantoea sp. Pent]|nr:DUF3732 domain-containing protein [Pantoea sp. Pent]